MGKDHIFLLGKVFGKEIYADEFISKGRFICNTLNYFKNYEDREANNIGDVFEGVEGRFTTNSGVKVQINGHDIDYKDLHFYSNKHLNQNAFCLYGPNIKEDEKVTPEVVANLIAIQEDAKNLGEYFVIIHNIGEFIRRFNEQLDKLGYEYKHSCVEYRELKENFEIQFNQIGFVKANKYSHQKEFRYLIDTGRDKDEPLFLEIGSISDIAFKILIDDFNKTFEIKLIESI